MNTAPETNRLSDSVARWKAALRASDTGPLVIAQDVVRIANEWDKYRAEVGNVDCTTWLRRELDLPLDFFLRRAKAVERLGEACRRTIHHEVAVWLSNRLKDDELIKKAMWALMSETKKRRGNCLTLPKAQLVVRKALGIKPTLAKAVACTSCVRMRALLKKHGIEE